MANARRKSAPRDRTMRWRAPGAVPRRPESRTGAARAVFFGLALAAAVISAGCIASTSSDGGGPRGTGRPEPLYPAEVREYRGAKLGSIEDFRENSIKGPQAVDRETYRLGVKGLVEDPLSLTYDEVLDRQLYQKVVTLNCVEGWSVTIFWEGVRVADLLEEAGADDQAEIVIFRAADGYSSSLPLASVRDRDLLLASKMNGVELPPERGFPFQLVAEDRWGYKWVKWITEIEVSNDTAFRGYWEQRGYSNEGELDEPSR